MKVLLVEDSADLQRTLARLLRRVFGDVDVWVADNADLAIEYLKASVLERQFDLVVSDWNLLGVRTGGDVLDWIEEHASHLVRRFIFVSSDESIRSRGVPWHDKAGDIAALRSTLQNVVSVHVEH